MAEQEAKSIVEEVKVHTDEMRACAARIQRLVDEGRAELEAGRGRASMRRGLRNGLKTAKPA